MKHRSRAASWPSPGAFLLALLLLPLLIATSASAQERHNFLAVDDAVVDAGPYYFVAYGDSSNAFARAAPLAQALGVRLHYDGDAKLLRFDDGSTRVEMATTSDVASGLRFRADALRVDGIPFGRAVPGAILVDGTSYVPITPVAEAFGAEVGWHQEARVITIDTAPAPSAAGPRLGDPRIGLHDGYTRIAIDVPDGQEARLAVADGALVLSFPGTELSAIDRSLSDGPLARVYSDRIAGDASLVLVVEHRIAPDGTGYRMGRTGSGVVYVDLGPAVRGEAVAPAQGVREAAAPTPAVIAPPPVRKPLVVIDAGHGAHDPGAVSAWAREKEVVLSVAMRLKARLEAEGIEVILTRDHDVFLTLQERSTFATTERNVFVSIHANSAANTSANGIETWVFGQPLDPGHIDQAIRENGGGNLGAARTQEAAAVADIAGDILRESQLNYSLGLANRVQDRLVRATGARDRGVRQNLFYVIRSARIPAILVELGFVSHPEEGRRLAQEHYQQTLADALGDGIVEFLRGGGELALR